jgi:hypothetical protein
MMKRYIITLLFICKICIVFAQPVHQHGQLRVEGANIVDRNGQKVALKGISLGWHNWWSQFYNSSVVEYLSRQWNISVIRAAMGVGPAMLKPEAGHNGNWSKDQLTEMGIYSKQIMKGRSSITGILLIIGALFVAVIVYVLMRK